MYEIHKITDDLRRRIVGFSAAMNVSDAPSHVLAKPSLPDARALDLYE
jgi:hypothetical protein